MTWGRKTRVVNSAKFTLGSGHMGKLVIISSTSSQGHSSCPCHQQWLQPPAPQLDQEESKCSCLIFLTVTMGHTPLAKTASSIPSWKMAKGHQLQHLPVGLVTGIHLVLSLSWQVCYSLSFSPSRSMLQGPHEKIMSGFILIRWSFWSIRETRSP